MIIKIVNKVVSIGGDSQVLDEQGKEIYFVNGKPLSPTRRKFLCDMQKNKIYLVRNKFWHLFTSKSYIINCETKEKIMKIKKLFFKKGYEVLNCADDWLIEPQGWFKPINFYRNKELVGSVKSGSNSVADLIRDCYTLEVLNEEFKEELIALTIALDNMRDEAFRSK